ncbi:hypothetical protein [uncultured Paraglaciecola sp.]|uniref:hypothetical protein n=1 Tax=uncultured Paraglaciecola sp. TaxID=1765024 RepID=UPI0030DD5EBF|tara:strand:+ start:961 stop:1740 length:780 start_codon:yes stop_codon:yes gene_type:complete
MIIESQREHSSALFKAEEDTWNILNFVEIGEIELEATSSHFELENNNSFSRIAALHAVADNINYELAKYISSKTNTDIILQSYLVHSGSIKWISKVFGKPRINDEANISDTNPTSLQPQPNFLVNTAAIMGILSSSWVIGPDVIDWVNDRLQEETRITQCIPKFKTATYVTPIDGQGIMALISKDCNTPYQIAYSLYNYNKEHFIDSNINMVRAGAQLKIPPSEEISKVSEEDARFFVKFSAYNQALKIKDLIRKNPDD